MILCKYLFEKSNNFLYDNLYIYILVKKIRSEYDKLNSEKVKALCLFKNKGNIK